MLKRDKETDKGTEIIELKKKLKELQRAYGELRKSEEMFRFLAENSIDTLWRIDDKFRFTYVSPGIMKIIGYPPEEIMGRHLFSILDQESIRTVSQGYNDSKILRETGRRWGSSTYTVRVIHKDGHYVWAEVTVNPIFGTDNRLIGYNGITRDISERRRNEEVIRQYAFLDPLTNLPNRRSFEEVLESVLDQYGKFNEPVAVIFLDVDGLKKVNDMYGHAAGDALLKTVADQLRQVMRKQDFIARLAGDEFMAILPGVGDCCTAKFIATRIIESFQPTIVIGLNQLRIGVSIGISFYPEDAENVNTLMNCADQAMYRAKEKGGNCCICYGKNSDNGSADN
jgi:diguanylate cyclase (GGDEF)-like protein/PAS domain S-box-containing protein